MKQSKITIPGVDIVQASLYEAEIPVPKYHTKFPEVKRSEKDLYNLLDTFNPRLGLGLDYEFDPKTYRPTIVGISGLDYAVSVPATGKITSDIFDACVSRGSVLVGYSVFGAEKPIIDKAIDKESEVKYWGDGLRSFFLANSVLCKSPGKEESDEGGSLGFMNLSTASTFYTGIPVYKVCRGNLCYGPCPYHTVFDYNGVDAWAGLQVHHAALARFYDMGGTEDVYERRMTLADLCYKIQQVGIHIDRAMVKKLDAMLSEKKKTLFTGADFSPTSGPQIIKKAKELGVVIAKSDIKQITKACEKELKKLGFSSIEAFEEIHGDGNEDFDPEIVAKKMEKLPDATPAAAFFYRMYKFKKTGKGTKSWFDDKYFGKDDLLHPRFNDTGTSLGRLSSSKPNFQNVARTGFGEEIRKCIVAPEGFDIVKADFSNLELRIILHQAGFDVTQILKLDPFQWLVDNSNGLFDDVAKKMNTGFSARDWAKSVSHASNLLEGLTLLSQTDLMRDHTKKLERVGALKVFRDWKFRGKIVAFTGANIAERLLGAKTEANRAEMLKMQWDIYFNSFPILNTFHRKLLADIEHASTYKLPGGMVIDLYGPDLDDCKIAAAGVGQGGGAAFVQEAMLRFYDKTQIVPFCQVHDDVNIYFPEKVSDEEVLDKMKVLVEPSTVLQGMICPAKVLRGKNWKENDMKGLGKIY